MGLQAHELPTHPSPTNPGAEPSFSPRWVPGGFALTSEIRATDSRGYAHLPLRIWSWTSQSAISHP